MSQHSNIFIKIKLAMCNEDTTENAESISHLWHLHRCSATMDTNDNQTMSLSNTTDSFCQLEQGENSMEICFNLLESLLRTVKYLPNQEIKEICLGTYWLFWSAHRCWLPPATAEDYLPMCKEQAKPKKKALLQHQWKITGYHEWEPKTM